MTTRYRLEPGQSRFTVQAFATGLLSFMGHNPTFAVRSFTGEIRIEGGLIEGTRLEVTANAATLELLDDVRPLDRREIEDRMRREVLEASAHPEVRFEVEDAAGETLARGRYRVRLNGRLTLHGVTQPHQVETELFVFDDGVRLRGQSLLRLSDFRIRPITALGGTIRLKDELKVAFDLAGLPEGP